MEKTRQQLLSLWWSFLLRDDMLSHQPRPHSPMHAKLFKRIKKVITPKPDI